MTKKLQSSEKTRKLKAILIMAGLLMTLGWAIIMLSSEFLVYDTPRALLLAPIIFGSALIPTGIVFDRNIPIILKALIVLVSGVIIYYVTFYLIVFAGIAVYGLGPR